MTLAYACIAPHGGEVIPGLASKISARKFAGTTRGMRILARQVFDSRCDTIVIASPHNLRLQGKIAVVISEYSSGSLQGDSGKEVTVRAKCDVILARRLMKESERDHLPVVGANYGTVAGEASNMPMDWGTLVPLWFMLKGKKVRPNIVIVTPSREIPMQENYRFGKTLGRLIKSEVHRRFVFIASADQAHAHSKSGPYGYNRSAADYDMLVVKAIKDNQLGNLLHLNSKFVERAKPDSLWQMVMLAGVTSIVPCESSLVSYQVPTYYGMLCASFRPKLP